MTTSSQGMSASERVHAAIKGQPVDRVPLVFWHHFKPEGSGQRLAEMTLDFFIGKFQLDIVKIMPDLPYPAPQQPVTQAAQWRDLPRLSVDTTESFQQQLVCIRAIREKLGNDYPLILTLFSPLTMLMRFVGKPAAEQMLRSDPDSCEAGMKTIAENLRDLMQAAIQAGASGIFFSCMAQPALTSRERSINATVVPTIYRRWRARRAAGSTSCMSTPTPPRPETPSTSTLLPITRSLS